MKNFTCKLIISFIIFIFLYGGCSHAKNKTFVSLAPAVTEIIYAINAEENLLAVSTSCDYPHQVMQKDKIGDAYYINKEKLLKFRPNYIFAVNNLQLQNGKLKKLNIETIVFSANSVNSVFSIILKIGELSGKYDNSLKLVKKLSEYIDNKSIEHPKSILYLVQLNPIITIGNKSYISDLIRKSGHISVTDGLNLAYPQVSYEYLASLNPDIVIVAFQSDYKKLKKIYPNKKIIFLNKIQNDVINRPGPRILEAVKFFREL